MLSKHCTRTMTSTSTNSFAPPTTSHKLSPNPFLRWSSMLLQRVPPTLSSSLTGAATATTTSLLLSASSSTTSMDAESRSSSELLISTSTRGDMIHNLLSFAPAMVLGIATAWLYQMVIQHPSSQLNKQSATLLLLLALQVSIQPKLSQLFIQSTDEKVFVAFMEEIVKTTLALILFYVRNDSISRKLALASWNWSSSLFMAAIPAMLYALQGVLTYRGMQALDPVTYNGLSQLKTASAAMFCYLLLGQTQSIQQMIAIALLIVAAAIFQQQPQSQAEGPSTSKAAIQTATISKKDKNTRHSKQSSSLSSSQSALTGATACLLATLVSGLAGALSQRGVQWVDVHSSGPVGRDPFLFAGEVSLYSALCLCVATTWNNMRRKDNVPRSTTTPQSSTLKEAESLPSPSHRQLRKRSYKWIIPITVKAMGGITTVLVHKYAGSVLKGFALVLGLILSGLYERNTVTPSQLIATILVLLSSWMHFTSP